MLAIQRRWLLSTLYTSGASPLALGAISQRSYSRQYNKPHGQRPTARKQSYMHQQDKKNQKAKDTRKEISEKAAERKEITQVHPSYAHAPKKESKREKPAKGDKTHRVINMNAADFEEFDIDTNVKGWNALPGYGSKVMYMVEDLPEEEGDETAEFRSESSGVQQLTAEKIQELMTGTSQQVAEEDQKIKGKEGKESKKGNKKEQEEEEEEVEEEEKGDKKKKEEKKGNKKEEETEKGDKKKKEEKKGEIRKDGKDTQVKGETKKSYTTKEDTKKEDKKREEDKKNKDKKDDKKLDKKEEKKEKQEEKKEGKKEEKKEDKKEKKEEKKEKKAEKKEEKKEETKEKKEDKKEGKKEEKKESKEEKKEKKAEKNEEKTEKKEGKTEKKEEKKEKKTEKKEEKESEIAREEEKHIETEAKKDEVYSKSFPDLFPPLEQEVKPGEEDEEGNQEDEGQEEEVDENGDVPGVTAADAFRSRPTNLREAAAGDRPIFPDYLPTVDEIVSLLRSERARDLVVINMKDKCNYTDYFVIATGRSNLHCTAMGENILRRYKPLMKKAGLRAEVEGATTPWVAVDVGSIWVHIFNPESRAHVALEKKHVLNTEDPALFSREDKDYFEAIDKFEESRLKKNKVR